MGNKKTKKPKTKTQKTKHKFNGHNLCLTIVIFTARSINFIFFGVKITIFSYEKLLTEIQNIDNSIVVVFKIMTFPISEL